MGSHHNGQEHIEDDEEKQNHVGEKEDRSNLGTDEFKLIVVDRAQHHQEELH